ncbi:MAG: hypothetical protein JW751_16220 [Polyangiaceae bacterium]|nr:hypothetical protein [Polyangiaceae bacterium]
MMDGPVGMREGGGHGTLVDAGGGSAHVASTRESTLVDALRQALGGRVRGDHASGEITADGLRPIPTSALTPPAGHPGRGYPGSTSKASNVPNRRS